MALGVHDEGLRAGDGQAERDGPLGEVGRVEGVAGGEDGVLGGAVHVRDARAGRGAQEVADQAGRGHVPAEQDVVHAVQLEGALADEQVEEAGRHHEGGDAERAGVAGDVVEGHEDGLVQGERAAREERAPDLQGGEVEAEAGEHEVRPSGAEVRVGLPLQEVDDALVPDGDALGRAGGAGREDDVRDVVPGAGRRLGGRGHAFRVGAHDAGAEAARDVLPVPVGEDERGARRGDHEGEARGRLGRVEREVRRAEPQRGEHPDDRVSGAGQQQADDASRADARAGEAGGEAGGARLEFGVADLTREGAQRGSVRAGPRLALEEVVQVRGGRDGFAHDALHGRGGARVGRFSGWPHEHAHDSRWPHGRGPRMTPPQLDALV